MEQRDILPYSKILDRLKMVEGANALAYSCGASVEKKAGFMTLGTTKKGDRSPINENVSINQKKVPQHSAE